MRKIVLLFGKLIGKVYQRIYRKMMIGDLKDMIKHNTNLNYTKTEG